MKDAELTAKRLMALGHLEAWITYEGGHRYLEMAPDDEYTRNLAHILATGKIEIRSKFYGPLDSVLDTIDLALQQTGNLRLEAIYGLLDEGDCIWSQDAGDKYQGPQPTWITPLREP